MPFPPKPGVKQWAGGGAPPPRPAPAAPPPAAPPPGAPPAPAAAPGVADPQMIARAYAALGQLIMGGGLPKEATDLLMQANQILVAAKSGAPPAPAPVPGAPPAAPPPAGPPAAGGQPKKPGGFPPGR